MWSHIKPDNGNDTTVPNWAPAIHKKCYASISTTILRKWKDYLKPIRYDEMIVIAELKTENLYPLRNVILTYMYIICNTTGAVVTTKLAKCKDW